jgi:hypothetical protein
MSNLISKGYRNYLRCENIRAILDWKYKPDYSFQSYYNSVFMKNYSNTFGDVENKQGDECPMCGYELEIFEGCYRCCNCGYCKS